MRRLKLLVLIDKISPVGGAERAAATVAAHLPQDRFDVWICSTRRADPAVVEWLTEAGVRHVNLGRRRKWDVHRLRGLAMLLRRESFDILHAHMFGSNLWGTLFGTACRVPVLVAHEHTWSFEGAPLRKWLDGRVIGRLADRFIAVSSLDAERMVALEHVPPEKIVTIPNVYVPRPQVAHSDLRAELGIDGDVPLVAAVAVLRPQKALSVLLEALALVRRQLPRARLAIAGDGPCLEELQAHARSLGIAEAVHFLGRRPDVDSILSAADVAAMSSDYEGTPLFVYECMSNRIPLVATAVGGLPDVVENGRTGVLVPPRDPPALAEALVRLLEDRESQERIAAAAAERLSDFGFEAAVERFATLYEALAAEAGLLPAAQGAASGV